MPTNPAYSRELKFSPTFRWGGREWGANDREAFERFLRSKRVQPSRFYSKHPDAARAFDPVEQQIYSDFQPLLHAIEVERQKKAEMTSRRVRDLAGFTQALGGMLGGISPAIRGAYEGAAGTMSGLGTGYGGILNQSMAADAGRVNSVLDTINAPEGQDVQGGDAGGVLAGLAGWIPSQMLTAQGKALGDAAAQLPKTAGWEAQLQLRSMLKEAEEDDQGFSDEVKQLLMKLPGARASGRSEQAKLRLAEQKQRQDAINDERNYWLKLRAYYISVGKLKLAADAEKRASAAERRYANESRGLDAAGNVAPGYTRLPDGSLIKRSDLARQRSEERQRNKDKGLDVNGNLLPGFKRDKSGRVVKVSTSSTRGLSPTARADALKTVIRQEEDISKTALPTLAKSTGLAAILKAPPSAHRTKEVDRLRKSVARALWVQYQDTAVTPQAKKALRRMIARVVKGYSPASSGSSLTEGLLP